MKTYLLCLKKDELRGLQAENTIFNTACKFGLKKENCENFLNVREFFRRLSEILEDGALVILAADTELFADAKSMLCSALSLNCQSLSNTSEDMNTVGLVPAEVTVLPSSDTAFSGFAVEKGKNFIIYLPLDDEKTPPCLGASFFSFMSKAIAETKNNSETSDNNLNYTMASIAQKATDICYILEDKRLTAALSLSNAGDKLCSLLPDMSQLSFFSSSLQRRNASPKDYSALLAKEAAELSGTNIGASITNVFKIQNSGEPQIFVCIAVADSKEAKVKKIYAQPGESALTLTACALDAVLDMIRERVISYDVENEENLALPTPSIENANRKRIFKYTACAGAAALFLCLSVGVGALIVNPNIIPASSNTGTSKNESGTSDKSDFDYKSFWESLFNKDSDEESTDDSPVIDEPANDDINTGDSSGTGTTSPSRPDQNTGSSESDTTNESRPTQQPTEKPTDETKPTESGTEDTSESTQEPSTEPPTETQPTESTEPTVPEDSTAAVENQPTAN